MEHVCRDFGQADAFDRRFLPFTERMIASEMYLLAHYQPVGWKNGVRMLPYVGVDGCEYLVIRKGPEGCSLYDLENHERKEDIKPIFIMDFADGFSKYQSGEQFFVTGNASIITNLHYKDEEGNVCAPDYFLGRYCDLGHLLMLASRSFFDVYKLLQYYQELAPWLSEMKMYYDDRFVPGDTVVYAQGVWMALSWFLYNEKAVAALSRPEGPLSLTSMGYMPCSDASIWKMLEHLISNSIVFPSYEYSFHNDNETWAFVADEVNTLIHEFHEHLEEEKKREKELFGLKEERL